MAIMENGMAFEEDGIVDDVVCGLYMGCIWDIFCEIHNKICIAFTFFAVFLVTPNLRLRACLAMFLNFGRFEP